MLMEGDVSMNMKQILREDFTKYIRPHFIEAKCEKCGKEINSLHLHHNIEFSQLLDETLQQLKLLYYDDINNYTEDELQLIRDIMLAKQARIKYTTCCDSCHKNLHGGNYFKSHSPRKHNSGLSEMTREELEALNNNLEVMYTKCKDNKYTFIKKDGLREIANTLQLYYKVEDGTKRYFCSSINRINTQLELLQLPYKIEMKPTTKRVNKKMTKVQVYLVMKK